MAESTGTKASMPEGLSRRKFLQNTGAGLSLLLPGMKVFAQKAPVDIETGSPDSREESGSVIKVHPANSHYYMYQGQPII